MPKWRCDTNPVSGYCSITSKATTQSRGRPAPSKASKPTQSRGVARKGAFEDDASKYAGVNIVVERRKVVGGVMSPAVKKRAAASGIIKSPIVVSDAVPAKGAVKVRAARGASAYAAPAAEPVRTKTLRLEPTLERGLAILKGVLKRPINKMVNDAVGEYIRRQTAQVESDLTTTLAQLQAYRRADPEFAAARQAFIEGEALYGKDDPMEGRIVEVTRPEGTP